MERKAFAAIPDFVSKCFEVAPWLYERGYFGQLVELLTTFAKSKLSELILLFIPLSNTRIIEKSEKTYLKLIKSEIHQINKDEWKTLTWERSRKPDTILRYRPRYFFPKKLAQPRYCPECQRWHAFHDVLEH